MGAKENNTDSITYIDHFIMLLFCVSLSERWAYQWLTIVNRMICTNSMWKPYLYIFHIFCLYRIYSIEKQDFYGNVEPYCMLLVLCYYCYYDVESYHLRMFGTNYEVRIFITQQMYCMQRGKTIVDLIIWDLNSNSWSNKIIASKMQRHKNLSFIRFFYEGKKSNFNNVKIRLQYTAYYILIYVEKFNVEIWQKSFRQKVITSKIREKKFCLR